MVFGTGFVLGPIRVLWLTPRVGVRTAELAEMPLMLVAIHFAARFVVRRYRPSRTECVRIGLIALAMLMTAEVSLGVLMRGSSPVQVLVDRDPVSGAAYYLSLAVFAAMPRWIALRQRV